jgi:hypothetical protein
VPQDRNVKLKKDGEVILTESGSDAALASTPVSGIAFRPDLSFCVMMR